MRNYILSVVSMAAIGGAALMLSPEGARSGIRKHIKLICSLCVLCVMIAPVGELMEKLASLGGVGGFDSYDEGRLESMYESIYEGNLSESFGEGIGESVKKVLKDKLAVPYDECRVKVSFSDNDGDGFSEPCRITVILSGGSVFKNPREVEGYVSESFGCECVCAVE